MANLTLFEIDAALQNAQERAKAYAEEHGGDMLPEHWVELDALEMSREAKIENCIKYYKNENALADMVEAELAALQARAKAHKNSAKRVKSYLAYVVKPGEKPEFGAGKIGWLASESVEVEDLNKLPEQYVKVERSARLLDLKAAIKRGEAFDGVKIVNHDNLQVK